MVVDPNIRVGSQLDNQQQQTLVLCPPPAFLGLGAETPHLAVQLPESEPQGCWWFCVLVFGIFDFCWGVVVCWGAGVLWCSGCSRFPHPAGCQATAATEPVTDTKPCLSAQSRIPEPRVTVPSQARDFPRLLDKWKAQAEICRGRRTISHISSLPSSTRFRTADLGSRAVGHRDGLGQLNVRLAAQEKTR